MELTITNMPKRDKSTIIGYSNLLFFISTIYLFDINKTKNVDIKIKVFEYKENLSTIKLSLKIFADSFPHIVTRVYLAIGITIISFLFIFVTLNDIFYK